MIDDGVAVDRQPESRALTGLRGFGALLVLLHHFSLHFSFDEEPSALLQMLRHGYLGVDLFFVLSGFVIAMVYGGWFQAGPSHLAHPGLAGRWALFLLRRAARLWPLHVVLLAATLASFWAEGVHFRILTVLANVLMVQAWGISTEINSPAWSVSTEWFAYLLFPLLARPLLRERAGVLVGIVAIVALLSIDLRLAQHVGAARRGPLDIYDNYSVLPVLRCLAGFMLGMITWRAGQSTVIRRVVANGWLAPVALVLMLALMTGRVNDLIIYPLLPLIVLGFHFGRGPAWRLFAAGPIYRLGVLSYAFYLVHITILQWFPLGWAPHVVELAAYVAVTFAVAAALHHVVERPSRVLLRRWGEAVLARLIHRPTATLPLHGGPG